MATNHSLVLPSFPPIFCILIYCPQQLSLGKQRKELKHFCILRAWDKVVSPKAQITSIQVDLREIIYPFFFQSTAEYDLKTKNVLHLKKKKINHLQSSWLKDE